MPEFDMHVGFLMGDGEASATPHWKPTYHPWECSAWEDDIKKNGGVTSSCVCENCVIGFICSPCLLIQSFWWCGENTPWFCCGCPAGNQK